MVEKVSSSVSTQANSDKGSQASEKLASLEKSVERAREKPLHANATTTPEMREFIQNSDLSTSELAKILNISEATVRKWRKRNSVEDKSHRPKNISTTLKSARRN